MTGRSSGAQPGAVEVREAVRVDSDASDVLRDREVVIEDVDRDRVDLLDHLVLDLPVKRGARGAVGFASGLFEPGGYLGIVDAVARLGRAAVGVVIDPQDVGIGMETRAAGDVVITRLDLLEPGTRRLAVDMKADAGRGELATRQLDHVEPLLTIALRVEEREIEPLAVLLADAVRSARPSLGIEDRVGPRRVGLPRAGQFLLGRAEHRRRQRRPRTLELAEVD